MAEATGEKTERFYQRSAGRFCPGVAKCSRALSWCPAGFVWLLRTLLQHLPCFAYVHGLAHHQFHFAEQRLRHPMAILIVPERCLWSFSSPQTRYSLGTSAYFASCPCCSLWLLCFPQSEPRHPCQTTERSRRLHQICRVSRINAHCQGQNRVHIFPPAPVAGRAVLCHSLG